MTERFDSSFEGELQKYTNVLKGYQKRFFAINPNSAELIYYNSEKVRHKEPRGTIKLTNAVILPAEEDDILFTIHTFEANKHHVSYLKANDKIERTNWINALKPNLNSEKTNNESVSELAPSNQCCICLDNAKQAVVTLCGHLYCKSCIHQWIDLKPTSQTCPVCNKSINKQKIVRLYGINEVPNNSAEISSTDLTSTDQDHLQPVNNLDPVDEIPQEDLHEIQAEYIAQESDYQVFTRYNNSNQLIESLRFASNRVSQMFHNMRNAFIRPTYSANTGAAQILGDLFIKLFYIGVAVFIGGVIFIFMSTLIIFLISPKLCAVYFIILTILFKFVLKKKNPNQNRNQN